MKKRQYGRTYLIDRVEMYKCEKCLTLFPYDSANKKHLCESCAPKRAVKSPPKPRKPKAQKIIKDAEQPKSIPAPANPRLDVIDKFYEYNADLVAQSREERRARSSQAAQTRRARESGVINTLTPHQWRNCRLYFDNKCAYCGEEKPLAQDHFVAVSKGGNYSVDNVLPACKSCNSSKRDREYERWYVNRPFFSVCRHDKIVEYLALMSP